MKIDFFDKFIIDKWLKLFSVITAITSFLFIFFDFLSVKIKFIIFAIVMLLLLFLYIFIYVYYKYNKKVKLKINNTDIIIQFGDLFESPGNRVVAFNEYFDTLIDNVIISSKSLNGILVNKLGKENIDNSIKNDLTLQKGDYITDRIKGKKQKYYLGQIHKIRNYFLLSFTKFNNENEAELVSNEYANCLLEMWKNLNVKYNGEEVSIPLLGSGITRIRDNMQVSRQELLEIMLITLKISKMTFKKPSKINIILYPGRSDELLSEFNFARIRRMFK